MNDQSFEETVARICDKDSKYDIEAYYFVREGLDYAAGKYKDGETRRHVTGQELCEALREYALDEFGPAAYLVLTEWNLTKTDDFGEIVYRLITEGVFGKEQKDSQDDFKNIYSFEDAFKAPYEPEPEPKTKKGKRIKS
ncbi:MAG: hypothetical protein FWG05_01090 [Kiritimatiellaeota bacterium]|nr:hypothetical protein [Kiritimatiellota bacterium]